MAKFSLATLAFIFIAALGYYFLRPPIMQMASSPAISAPIPTPAFVPYQATFDIYTLGTKRIFTDPKYHRRSQNVFIDTPDPRVIHVQQPQLTWQDFFNTLPPPMKLTPDCLYTGTGQTFCTGSSSRLRFFLNDQDTPDALTHQIQPDDHLKVEYN